MLFRRTTLLATLLATTVAAHGPSAPPKPAPSGLLIADGGRGGVLEIVRHDVKVVINNGVAVTTIDQVFHNTEGRTVEALYTFPVPKRASVANFSMWIQGKEMVGEVVEKQRAREIYNSYKRVNRDPGLLEQVDYKTFEMRIFPILADAEQRVRVEYYQELDVDDNWCTYTYPLATTSRPGLDAKVKGRFSLTLAAKSAVPIRGMSSPSHKDDFVITKHSDSLVEASLEVTGGELDRDLVIAWELERAETGLDFITSKDRGEDGFLQMTLTAGKELDAMDSGMDYVFVSDVSGSMANDGKLAVSQQSIHAFVAALGAKDRFELISFNAAAETLFGQLANPSEGAQTRARTFLDAQRARGGTRLRPALRAAFRYLDDDRPLNVVILSDGMTEPAEHRELLGLIRNRPKGSRVFCIGIGNDVNRPLLRQVAQSTGGLAAFLSRGDDFERQAKGFRRKLMRPAIAEVDIRVDGVPVYGTLPNNIPNLYHGAPLRMYARYKRGGKATVTLSGTIQGAPFKQRYQIELPATDGANPEIERMWAWHRVQGLLDQERASGETGKFVPEIVELCEGFSIPSEYASFLVLENDAEYKRWKIERRNATRLQRDRKAQARVREQLDRIRDQAERKLGPNPVAKAPAQKPAPRPSPRRRTPTRRSQPQRTSPQPTSEPDFVPQPRRRGGGGGAIDPLTGSLMLGLLIGLVLFGRRRM